MRTLGAACSDGPYATADRKEYGTYNWYIGDGGLPGALSKNDALWTFYEALDNITESHNNCGYSDQVDAYKVNFPRTNMTSAPSVLMRPGTSSG